MFGYHKARREAKRAAKKSHAKPPVTSNNRAIGNNVPNHPNPTPTAPTHQTPMEQQADQNAQKAKEERARAREEGRQYSEEIFNRKVQGLSPEEKAILQFEANRQVKRSHQAANRKLLGDQGMHGIMGKSGVAYAQQRDLQQMSDEISSQKSRDLDRLDKDLEMKKRAAMFSIEQGEAAQNSLDKQMAIDQLKLEEEKRKNQIIENKLDDLFKRL